MVNPRLIGSSHASEDGRQWTHRRFMKIIVLVIMLLSLQLVNTPAQTAAASASPPEVQTTYEPTPAFPYGRLNPEAPPETKEFAFMIGEFDCVDQIRDAKTGKWLVFPAIWNARYFLNGHGIQDQYWSPRFFTSNIRIFNVKKKRWIVTFFQMPNYNSSPPWVGQKKGDDLVMKKGDNKTGSRLTFHNIKDWGFDWVGERLIDGRATPFWKSSCKRRR